MIWFIKGMVVMLVYNIFGLCVLMMKCTNATGEGKAEVKDVILWQLLWPLPVLIAIVMSLVGVGKSMLYRLPKKKKGDEK